MRGDARGAEAADELRLGAQPQATPSGAMPANARAALAGEGLYSVRGSPLKTLNGAPTTVKATVKSKHCTASSADAASAVDAAASLVIELPTGNVDLSAPGAVQAINNAAPEVKEDALAKKSGAGAKAGLGATGGTTSTLLEELTRLLLPKNDGGAKPKGGKRKGKSKAAKGAKPAGGAGGAEPAGAEAVAPSGGASGGAAEDDFVVEDVEF